MYKIKNFAVVAVFLCSLFPSCGEGDDMPQNDHKALNTEAYIGIWIVENAATYLEPDNLLASWIVGPAEKKVEEKLLQNGANKTLCFTEDELYRFSTDTKQLEASCSYYLGHDTLYFSDPYILNFYIPYVYGKFQPTDSSLFIGYLNKKEAIELIKHDDEISQYASIIESNVKSAQCELHFRKGDENLYYQFLDLIP